MLGCKKRLFMPKLKPTLLLFGYIIVANTLWALSDEHENLSNHLIISIANLSGTLCKLESIDLMDATITRNAPPSILANQSERSFWIANQSFSFNDQSNKAIMRYRCGSEQISIKSIQHSCNIAPYGEILKQDNASSNKIQATYHVIPGNCNNGSPGVIMWTFNASIPSVTPPPSILPEQVPESKPNE